MFAFFIGSQFANLLEVNAAGYEATPDEAGETLNCATTKENDDLFRTRVGTIYLQVYFKLDTLVCTVDISK